MTITEAKKKCDELRKKIEAAYGPYQREGFDRYMVNKEMKPVREELDKLMTAIHKAENETKIISIKTL